MHWIFGFDLFYGWPNCTKIQEIWWISIEIPSKCSEKSCQYASESSFKLALSDVNARRCHQSSTDSIRIMKVEQICRERFVLMIRACLGCVFCLGTKFRKCRIRYILSILYIVACAWLTDSPSFGYFWVSKYTRTLSNLVRQTQLSLIFIPNFSTLFTLKSDRNLFLLFRTPYFSLWNIIVPRCCITKHDRIPPTRTFPLKYSCQVRTWIISVWYKSNAVV